MSLKLPWLASHGSKERICLISMNQNTRFFKVKKINLMCCNWHFLKRYLYTYVHCSVIHNSPEMEATQVFTTDEWINEMCLYTQWNIIQLWKDGNSGMGYNMDEPWRLWNKPFTKKKKKQNPLVWEIYRVLKFIDTESRMVVVRSWGWGEEDYCLIGTEFQFEMMKMFQMVVMIPQQCECT